MPSRPLALAVLADLPHPPRSGNHLRDLQTLRILAYLGFDVHVVAGRRSWAGDRSLGAGGVLHASVAVPDESTSLRGRLHRLGRLVVADPKGGHPGPWALPYADAGLPMLVEAAIADLQPQVVVLRSTLAYIAPLLRAQVRTLILDVHDSDLLQARSLFAVSPPHRKLAAYLRILAARRNDKVADVADEVWVTSLREREHFDRYVPQARTIIVPNGVPVPNAPPSETERDQDLLLVAGFGYPPNLIAARRLVEGIFPLVRQTFPEVSVTLAGRDLAADCMRRWSAPSIRLLGVVDDVLPLYRSAAALVLPYHSSTQTGTPLKVAEAIAQGLPVVASPNATDGLGLENSKHVLVGETDEELADHLCRLLSNPLFGRALARRAYAFAKARLAPEQIADRLRRESCIGSGDPVMLK